MCEAEGTTREHVPPRCLFLRTYRDPAWTVPSCETHNTKKSKDDEFLKLVLLSTGQENEIGAVVYESVQRAIKEKPKLYGSLLRPGGAFSAVPVFAPDGTLDVALALAIPEERHETVLQQVACGLFYLLYDRPFYGKVSYFPLYAQYRGTRDTMSRSRDAFYFAAFIEKALQMYDFPQFGDHRQVFYFRHFPIGEAELIQTVFYEGVQVVFIFEHTAEPAQV